jgi:hypothetical protein
VEEQNTGSCSSAGLCCLHGLRDSPEIAIQFVSEYRPSVCEAGFSSRSFRSLVITSRILSVGTSP